MFCCITHFSRYAFWYKTVFCVLIMTKYCSLLRQVVFCNHISILVQVFVFLGVNHYLNFFSFVSIFSLYLVPFPVRTLQSSSLPNTSFHIVKHYITSVSFPEKSLLDHWFCYLIWTGSSLDHAQL